MATEQRLIEADEFHAFLEGVRQDYLDEDSFSSVFAAEVIETVQDEYLAKFPTIEARPVVHGRWFHDWNNLYACSECGGRETMSPKKLKNFCPNCGAQMDGGADNG